MAMTRTKTSEAMVLILFCLLFVWGCGGEDTRSESGPDGAVSEGATAALQHEGGGQRGTISPGAAQAQGSDTPAAPGSDTPAAQKADETGSPADPEPGLAADEGQLPNGFPELPLPQLLPPEKRRPVPDMVVKDMAGHPIAFADLKGQVVLAVFWATWCPPCKKEIPQLVYLQDTYAKAGLKILGISMDQKGLSVVKPFVRGRREINYTIIPSGIRAAYAFGGAAGIRRIPTSFLIDKHGRIIKKLMGLSSLREVEALVQAALQED
ncbi:MAG: redoxin domain-containing protein [Candidatus Eisenbacteria sp.]|nr:redoxin domain-containing protein [Candidatus Eisenbacteria bacterium]